MASKTDNFKKKNNNRNIGALIGSIVILLIVVVSFVLSPALSKLGQSQTSDIVLGSYGNEKITFSFLKETPFRQELASLSNNSTDTMDPRLAQVAYKRAVTKAAAIEEFNSNGYLITKEQLDNAVLNSGYYNVNGSFSPSVFKNTTEAKKQELRVNIKREMQVESWMYHTIIQQKRSSKYLEFISSMSNKKRNFDYITYDYSDYPDELVLDYASSNPKKFTELSLSRITVKDMKTADEVINKLKNNENTFGELAMSYSTDNFKTSNGEMSSTTYEYELESIFGITNSDDLLNSKVGDLPVVVEKDGSVILLTLNSEIVKPDFKDLTNIRSYMLSFERGIIEDYFYDKINSNTSNELAALGKEIKSTGLFSINFGGEQLLSTSIDRVSQNSIFSRAVNNDNFFTTLFSLENDTLSEPIVLGDTISVFKLKEELVDDTNTQEFILSSLDRALLNYKSQVSEDLILKSDKYVDNFYTGYFEILKINQGI
ncbi:hypothetical protein EW093_00265 [Thiospirochaeta perfilievii]|uniref:PpiC domain-containing protein n=1 Tax=Thiospirochaeta perfilievii TaxID=252967 RepID=A0A5C1Q8B5_9SPIO|nr:SurA N-terminal domain-containing protein [Thiospirochaeta perfilievii]QEN03199.1 hypothetical protein EW093_00265 [Thiospirochaeta perfilievii]